MTRIPSATGSGDSHDTVDTTRTSDTTELGERDEVVITVAEATSFSTIISEDDDAPAKPRYRPGDVIIEHDDLVDADIPPPSYRDKTKAVRLMVVDAAAYAQLVLENQGRTLSVQDAAVELGRLRAIPLPPRAGEEPRV